MLVYASQVQPGQTISILNTNWSVKNIKKYEWFIPGLKPWRILTLVPVGPEAVSQLDYMFHDHDHVEIV